MKKKYLIYCIIVTIILGIISFCCLKKEYKVTIDLQSESYSYLPDSAKEFIVKEAEKGKKVLTEKNKKEGQLYLNPRYIAYLAMAATTKQEIEVIPEMYTWDYKPSSETVPSTSSYYNLDDDNYVTKIKDQSTLGICWAFATYSAIETNILVSNLEENEVNFAERQLDYLMSDNSIKEINNPYSITDHVLGSGSNFSLATTYLNSGVAPVEENIWGDYDISFSKRNISEVINTENVAYQVTGYNSYGSVNYADASTQEQYRNTLKEHIMNYGSLYVSVLSPAVDLAGTCYDYELNMINETGTCNKGYGYHAMSIIGWDDEYADVGAWILKNSWGNYVPYTYLAYSSLYFDVNGVTEVKYRNWDNAYDYTKNSDVVVNANNVEKKYYKSSDFDESLVRISFTHESLNGQYNVYVKNSKNGIYQLIETVNTTYPGLATVEIDNVLLDDSEFSIKIISVRGAIGEEINAFTVNNSDEVYTEEGIFTYTGSNYGRQFIYRNISSGINLPIYLFDKYGHLSFTADNYVVNGSSDVNLVFPSEFKKGEYYLTFNENFFDVAINDEFIELDLLDNNSYQVDYIIDSKLTVESLRFNSSNTNIATISNTGLIQAVAVGKTTITMTVNENITRSIQILVGPIVTVGHINIVEEDQTIYRRVFDSLQLNVEVYPEDATIEDITWISSNESIATVDDKGLVKTKKAGNVTITVTVDDCSDQVALIIKDTALGLTLDKTTTTIYKNDLNTVTLTPTFNDSERIIKYTWTSSDESVATVDNGVVTGISNGTARIIVTAFRERYAAGAIIYVVDEEVYFDLAIDPNKGTYNNLENYKYTKNSLEVVTIDNPIYETEIEFVYNVNSKENEKILLNHTFLNWILTGSGSLNGNNYTFGFKNAKLTANWSFKTLTLPDISLFDSNRKFIGWYSDDTLTNFIGRNITYVPITNTTLYAKWLDVKLADVNADQEIDITDLVILRKHLAEITELTELNLIVADINGDDLVDITDLVILRRHLAGLEEIE